MKSITVLGSYLAQKGNFLLQL